MPVELANKVVDSTKKAVATELGVFDAADGP
jgi:hypothetical protein